MHTKSYDAVISGASTSEYCDVDNVDVLTVKKQFKCEQSVQQRVAKLFHCLHSRHAVIRTLWRTFHRPDLLPCGQGSHKLSTRPPVVTATYVYNMI